ncbi:flagellar export chaperone FliS [Pontibacillus litoralis]|uniref:Flagellar secretion chaperone FliS n=1 Tax=Pontibacillus litoralis JSM 072002 TaxID=1385512 RepID=A0A0A5G5D1_9BACI|nr:flagellar export chaperone FliS [Pontibacillus litoralis]KGX86305.1 flagellar biosynthesis protein FliS [Pontibacillus litoralis JSM 072002]
MSTQVHEKYQNNSIQTASPSELTLMLYNGCLKFIKLAKRGIEEGNYESKNMYIQKAQNIVSELMITMDPEYEITKQIMPLYEYLNHRLLEANMQNDVKILDEVEGFVVEFRDTWKEVIKLTKNQQKGIVGNV